MTSTLEGKVVLVTGGSNGIGAAIVSDFLSKGAKVASLDILPQTDSAPKNVLNLECDISSEESLKQAVDKIVSEWNQLDVLVNCAGVMDAFDRVGTVTNEMWTKVLSIDLTGPMMLTRLCLPHLLKSPDGNIINIGSNASTHGGAAGVAYTAAKHGLLGLSRHTAFTYGKEGLRCNIVLPGGIETQIMDNTLGHGMDGEMPKWMKKVSHEGLEACGPWHKCMVKTSKAEDVARVVTMLASATGVSGAEIAVDAGWSAA